VRTLFAGSNSILLQRDAGLADGGMRTTIGIIFDSIPSTGCFLVLPGAGRSIYWREIESLGKILRYEKEMYSHILGSGSVGPGSGILWWQDERRCTAL